MELINNRHRQTDMGGVLSKFPPRFCCWRNGSASEKNAFLSAKNASWLTILLDQINQLLVILHYGLYICLKVTFLWSIYIYTKISLHPRCNLQLQTRCYHDFLLKNANSCTLIQTLYCVRSVEIYCVFHYFRHLNM